MIPARCYECRKIRMTGLPSDYDHDWLDNVHLSIDWRCKTCQGAKMAEKLGKAVEIIDERHYLIKLREVVPVLSSVAAIVMICLEIAWHTS